MRITITLLFLGFSSFIICQGNVDKILGKTNVNTLISFANIKSVEYYNNYNKALALAIEKGWPTKNLYSLDKNGYPIYIDHTNTTAAAITNTDQINNGGSSGLSLDGNGFNIGLWEAGPDIPRITHFNLVTSGTQRVIVQDGTSSVHDHATHVAGTLVGDGSSNSQTKGMASQAQILAYGADNDEAEMATAAAGGLLISNHSYGSRSGWRCDNRPTCSNWTWYGNGAPFDNTGESWNFGQYNDTARDWDMIASNAPFYTIFKSAGNDNNNLPSNGDQVRNNGDTTYIAYNAIIHPNADGSHNGGFDCIPTYGTAKNIITVGAIQDDGITIANFSGTGPTDDGRIKPDIVGNGVSVVSSTSGSNTEVGTLNGTSMATPNVSGSAILLQEHYQNLFGTGNFMTSAMLKALLIHTTTDLGNPGPDYSYGWGLMNSAAAADLLSDAANFIGPSLIDTTYSGTLQQIGYLCECGNTPLKFTMVYTDLPGVAQSTLDNTNPNLVNDLDISFGTQATKMPFILNPNNPAANATRGDNDLDNVEQISFNFPSSIEIMTISHEGSLTGTQDYSVIASGIPLTGTCNVTIDQINGPIENGNYCNKDNLTTRAIIINKNTYHTSETSITLKPGFYSGGGSKSKFKINPPCVYVF